MVVCARVANGVGLASVIHQINALVKHLLGILMRKNAE
jgi:hypothetical protein